jgi:glycosyltransferase involved in cell wall biosynthesis
MKISVILAVYNEDRYFLQCLDSLIKQKGVNLEILVVDDGSTKEIYKDTFPLGVRYFKKNHSGTALARNFGASKASGKVLVFVDGDMIFERDFLSELTKPIKEGKSKGTYSTEEYVGNWDNVWARCWNYENGLKTKRRIHPEREDMVRDFRAILKSEFDRVKGFSNTGYTDTWSLSQKLNYLPTKTRARYLHFNPSSLYEVLNQAVWIGKRQRKFGIIGKLAALVRCLFPLSLILGVYKGLKHLELRFVIFKLVYDFGIIWGIVSSLIYKTRSK